MVLEGELRSNCRRWEAYGDGFGGVDRYDPLIWACYVANNYSPHSAVDLLGVAPPF